MSSTQNRLEKGFKLVSHVRKVIEKIKIKSKKNFEVRHSFMKLLLAILRFYPHFVTSKRFKLVYHVHLAVKILKSGKIRSISCKSWYRSGFNSSATNCILYISLVSFWHHFLSSMTRCAQIQYDTMLAIMMSELGLKFKSLRNLYMEDKRFASKFL